MTAWVLIVVFMHQEGVHSLSVPFSTQVQCEQAAVDWRYGDGALVRMRAIKAKCHATGYK